MDPINRIIRTAEEIGATQGFGRRVAHTGPGIAPEALSRVFERFYQANAARTGTGTGLGLALARSLVEAMHGTIGVESRLGAGTLFTATLPRAIGEGRE